MGKLSRDKGARFERYVANELSAAGHPAKRGRGQYRGGGDGPDVELEDWWIECKVGAAPSPIRALEQALSGMRDAGVALWSAEPVAICKMDRCDPTVTMSLASFICLLNDRRTLQRLSEKVATDVLGEAMSCETSKEADDVDEEG